MPLDRQHAVCKAYKVTERRLRALIETSDLMIFNWIKIKGKQNEKKMPVNLKYYVNETFLFLARHHRKNFPKMFVWIHKANRTPQSEYEYIGANLNVFLLSSFSAICINYCYEYCLKSWKLINAFEFKHKLFKILMISKIKYEFMIWICVWFCRLSHEMIEMIPMGTVESTVELRKSNQFGIIII